MSNVLKKITKKYKWLRFLNRKVTKLSVLGASLVGLCISSGASFAKYRDENYGNGNAGAAKFGAEVSTFSKLIMFPSQITVQDEGYYAYVADVKVDFSGCEVKCNYTLSLKLNSEFTTKYEDSNKLSKTFFEVKNFKSYVTGYTQKSFYTTIGENYTSATIVKENVPNLLTDSQCSSFSVGKMYYAFSNDDVTYSWKTTSNTNEREIILVDSKLSINIGDIHYYKVVYFVEVDGNIAEASQIFSKITIEQEV